MMEHSYSKIVRSKGKALHHFIGAVSIHCMWICAIASIWSTGCDPVEDDYSGTYREIATENGDDLLAIDFFRFGDNAMGLMRNYRSALSEEPFSKEQSCSWTNLSSAPDEEGNFTLSATTDIITEGFELKGKFLSETRFEATINYDDGDSVKKIFERVKDEPNNICNTIKPYLISPQFKLNDLPQVLPADANYTMRRPVFVTLWLGVRAVAQGGAFVYVGKQSAKPFFYLNDKSHRSENGIKGNVSLSIPKPDDEMLIASGQTSFALAHFVVIDDECKLDEATQKCTDDLPSRFSWDTDKEPIIATSLQFGEEQSDDFPSDANGLGKAIFFVEGRLSQLHPSIKDKIVNIEQYKDNNENKHFYIVDVFFKDDAVVGMRLPKDPSVMDRISYREVQLKLTRDYLNTSEILLPRLITLENL